MVIGYFLLPVGQCELRMNRLRCIDVQPRLNMFTKL